jgi:hypothetical protein
MKKLLALLLVLGMASMANAAVSLMVSQGEGLDRAEYTEAVSSQINLYPTDTIWIGVGSDGSAGGYDGGVYIVSGAGSWTGNVATYDSGMPYQYGPFPYAGGYAFYNSTPATVGPTPGADFGIEFHFDAQPDTVVIELRNLAGGLEDTLEIHQIPEPVTLSLLGLGGLALLRRRR